MSAEDELRESTWAHMQRALDDAARDFRRTADELNRIEFDDSKGRRSPDAIISQAALTAYTNTASTMVHRLASWAETLHAVGLHTASRTLCGYRIEDPETVCILSAGHTLPTDDGLLVHISAEGVKFA